MERGPVCVIERTHIWYADGELKPVPFDPSKRHIRKQFPWVPDGVYDCSKYQVRYQIVQGFVMIVISKMWLDNGGPENTDMALRLPWGTYVDLPEKPQKT
jgi:hypothetical protein